jgi:hypothetical protein
MPRSISRAGWAAARRCKRLAFYLLPPFVYDGIKTLMPRFVQGPVRRQFAQAIVRRAGHLRLPALARIAGILDPTSGDASGRLVRYFDVHHMGENTAEQLAAKRERVAQLYGGQLEDRARLLRELGRLASLEGREMVACAYRVRAIRLMGGDPYDDLPLVCRNLKAWG